MKKKVLITGGAGFIGSDVKNTLSKSDCEILTVGRNKKEDYEIDLQNLRLEKIISDFSPDIVCHFASGSNIQRAGEDKEKDFTDTVVSTQNLINCLFKKPVKIIYLSSQSVYGFPEYLPVSEVHPAKPVTIYGENKLKAERLIIQSKLNHVIFRVSSVFGGGQDYSKSGVIAKFISRMKNNQSPLVFNSFDLFCDLIYINDLTSAIVKAIDKESIKNEIFNLGSGKSMTLKEILDILYKYFPNAPRPELIKNSFYMDKKEKCLYLDITKAQTKLQWSLKYSVEDGLKEILQSHLIIK